MPCVEQTCTKKFASLVLIKWLVFAELPSFLLSFQFYPSLGFGNENCCIDSNPACTQPSTNTYTAFAVNLRFLGHGSCSPAEVHLAVLPM